MNIIFGIIIETFAELRDKKILKINSIQNQCFICELSRRDFEIT